MAKSKIKTKDPFLVSNSVEDRDTHLESKIIRAKIPADWEPNHFAENTQGIFAEHMAVKTVPDLIKLLESDKNVQVEAKVIFVGKNKEGRVSATTRKLDRDSFVETYKGNRKRTFREAIDVFASNGIGDVPGGIGNECVPLLGGPFNKQLYLYDYLKMHTQSFYAYNHDPLARAAVHIIRDFVLGRGWRVDSDNKEALALWKAFEEVNDLYTYMDQFVENTSIYGEIFTWWLPNNETKIAYQIRPGQEPSRGVIPRIRQIDPSVIWEIVTYPEDIKRILYYQWVAPTQYQLYTGSDKGSPVPTTKFIYQQLPAADVDHYKINCRSNEKRGRSDLFPVLGYLKRLRDSVNYSIIGLQKATAWSVDTTIKGDQSDIDSYVEQQQQIGTIPPAGSEFVHSEKITRAYMSNEAASRGGNSNAFDWCFSMICAGLGIPQQYFGTHMSGAGSRGNAIVATEPIVKKFEMRRSLVEQCLQDMAKRLFKQFGIDAEIEVTFPELTTQDRSAKLKDLALAESQKWLSPERCAEIAAKEFGVTDFDWNEEQIKIKGQQDAMPVMFANPLSAPAQSAPPEADAGSQTPSRQDTTNAADRSLRQNRGY